MNIHSKSSKWEDIYGGVSRGSILGPLLCNTFNKVGLSPSKKFLFIYINEGCPLKMIKMFFVSC